MRGCVVRQLMYTMRGHVVKQTNIKVRELMFTIMRGQVVRQICTSIWTENKQFIVNITCVCILLQLIVVLLTHVRIVKTMAIAKVS